MWLPDRNRRIHLHDQYQRVLRLSLIVFCSYLPNSNLINTQTYPVESALCLLLTSIKNLQLHSYKFDTVLCGVFLTSVLNCSDLLLHMEFYTT